MSRKPDVARENQVKRGRKLEYFTIIYNSLEGLISIIAGLIAGSVSLIGFGIDPALMNAAAIVQRSRHYPVNDKVR